LSGLLAWGPRRAAVSLGVTQTVAYAGSLYLPAILARPMAADLGVSTSFVFGAFSAALVLNAVLGQVVGRAVDIRGGRTLLVVSNLVFAAGLTALALAPTPAWFAAAWLVMGLGMALGLYDVAFAGLVGWFGAAARNPITGVTLIAGFASTVGWPLTAWLEADFGWRAACGAWAVAHLLLALPLHLTLPRGGVPPHQHTAAKAGAGGAGPSRGVIVQMGLMALAFAAMSTVASAVAADLPPMLVALGAAPAVALTAAALVGPAQVAARLAEFAVMRRAHPLISARLAVALFPIGAAALLLLGPTTTPLFVILYGCGNGLFTIARGSLPLAIFGAAGYGARLGLISMPSRFLSAGAPFGFALLMERSPRNALLVLVSLSVLGLVCLLALRRPPPIATTAASPVP
jgi:MFS family permease